MRIRFGFQSLVVVVIFIRELKSSIILLISRLFGILGFGVSVQNQVLVTLILSPMEWIWRM